MVRPSLHCEGQEKLAVDGRYSVFMLMLNMEVFGIIPILIFKSIV